MNLKPYGDCKPGRIAVILGWRCFLVRLAGEGADLSLAGER
jgi:hypothetical protein